jgi:hypothetical protein
MTSAKIICDSVNVRGDNLTTYEIEVPRIVWAEFMTHRMFSRNAASSRAIPFSKMQQQLVGIPERFGAANKGMGDGGEHTQPIQGREVYDNWTGEYAIELLSPEHAWEKSKEDAQFWAEAFYDAGYAKQIYNRMTEPYQMIKGLVTATDFDNFFWLRDDSAADPTIEKLAQVMWEAKQNSFHQLLLPGQWHLPYVDTTLTLMDVGVLVQEYFIKDSDQEPKCISLKDAITLSCARSAAISYRNENYTLEKCYDVYGRLIGDVRKHSSAMEHAATPMVIWTAENNTNYPTIPNTWEDGISHMDKQYNLWSGNIRGFIQHRKTIPNENYKKS